MRPTALSLSFISSNARAVSDPTDAIPSPVYSADQCLVRLHTLRVQGALTLLMSRERRPRREQQAQQYRQPRKQGRDPSSVKIPQLCLSLATDVACAARFLDCSHSNHTKSSVTANPNPKIDQPPSTSCLNLRIADTDLAIGVANHTPSTHGMGASLISVPAPYLRSARQSRRRPLGQPIVECGSWYRLSFRGARPLSGAVIRAPHIGGGDLIAVTAREPIQGRESCAVRERGFALRKISGCAREGLRITGRLAHQLEGDVKEA